MHTYYIHLNNPKCNALAIPWHNTQSCTSWWSSSQSTDQARTQEGNTWSYLWVWLFCFSSLTFYFWTVSLLSILLWTFSHYLPLSSHIKYMLSDLLLFSCTWSALTLWRLGLSDTQTNLAYLYKMLTFAHLYIPQSCYHKSSCLPLNTWFQLQQFSPHLLFSAFQSIIELLIETPSLTNSAKTDMSLWLTVYSLTWLRLNQVHFTGYNSKPSDYILKPVLLNDRLQESPLNSLLNQIISLSQLNFDFI